MFGSRLDIAADRIGELTLWAVFTEPGLVPLWVLIVFLVRGIVVDALRALQLRASRGAPFTARRILNSDL